MASRYPGVACFWLEPTGEVRVGLRRYSSVGDCPQRPGRYSCHDACVEIGEAPLRVVEDLDGTPVMRSQDMVDHADPRWPSVCGCGYVFSPDEPWQVTQKEIYERHDNGGLVAFRGYGGPPGALYDAWWLAGWAARNSDGSDRPAGYTGPDGISLVAVCPNGGFWMVDGPSGNGLGWTREGDPRQPATLSVSPSIVAGDYHGYLQHGRFTDDLGS